MTNSVWIGVDLDGTLAEYTSWKGHTHIGDPIWPMVMRVKGWLVNGHGVKIFTARWANINERGETQIAIHEFLVRAGLPHLEITNVKDYAMIELWDDRCVQVKPNIGEPVVCEKCTSKLLEL